MSGKNKNMPATPQMEPPMITAKIEIKAINPDIPVVMLSSQDKIEVAINCMHHRAYDYVVKSETAFVRLQSIITKIFKYRKMEKELNWYMSR